MFYLIQNDVVYDVTVAQYAVDEKAGFFWVEDEVGVAVVHDHYIDKRFIPRYSLEQRRLFCLSGLEVQRNFVMESGIILGDRSYYTDNNSVSLIHQALSLELLGIKSIFPREWILASGEIISISLDEIKELASAIYDKKNAAYQHYIDLAAKLSQSEDPESIDIYSGW